MFYGYETWMIFAHKKHKRRSQFHKILYQSFIARFLWILSNSAFLLYSSSINLLHCLGLGGQICVCVREPVLMMGWILLVENYLGVVRCGRFRDLVFTAHRKYAWENKWLERLSLWRIVFFEIFFGFFEICLEFLKSFLETFS